MKLCGHCGKREVQPKGDLQVPTCGNCGCEWIDRSTAKRLDEFMAKLPRSSLKLSKADIKDIAQMIAEQEP